MAVLNYTIHALACDEPGCDQRFWADSVATGPQELLRLARRDSWYCTVRGGQRCPLHAPSRTVRPDEDWEDPRAAEGTW